MSSDVHEALSKTYVNRFLSEGAGINRNDLHVSSFLLGVVCRILVVLLLLSPFLVDWKDIVPMITKKYN